MKVVILDFDGTVIFSGFLEKICRKIFKKLGLLNPPRFFLALSEILDFFIFFSLGEKKIKVREHIVKLLNQKEILVGILTDRSKWSLLLYLEYIGIEIEKLAFVQARKSIFDFFDFFSPCGCNMLTSPKIKPASSVYEKLIIFTEEAELKRSEVLIIDDMPEARKVVKKLGFLALDPDDPKLLDPKLRNAK